MALKDFQDWQRSKVGRSMYLWGSQGHICRGYNDICRFESKEENRLRALVLYENLCAKLATDAIEAFDCSGYGMCWLQNLTHEIPYDTTADGMLSLCDPIPKSEVKNGDWCFRVYPSTTDTHKKGDAYHIGYVNGEDVLECEGRDTGVIAGILDKKTSKGAMYWNVFGRPRIFKTEIENVVPQPTPVVVPTLTRLLKLTDPMTRGEDVRILQEKLTALGFPCGTIDGVLGGKTYTAVKSFQSSRGLATDGVVGTKTWSALFI